LLTADQVVDIAITLADDGGVVGLSMPKLTSRLEDGTMTLYGYVADTQQAARPDDGQGHREKVGIGRRRSVPAAPYAHGSATGGCPTGFELATFGL